MAKKKSKLEKDNELLRSLLYDLVYASQRVSSKFGVHPDGEPSDWEEWVAVRTAIQQALTKGGVYDHRTKQERECVTAKNGLR